MAYLIVLGLGIGAGVFFGSYWPALGVFIGFAMIPETKGGGSSKGLLNSSDNSLMNAGNTALDDSGIPILENQDTLSVLTDDFDSGSSLFDDSLTTAMDTSDAMSMDSLSVNPATGLPMIGGEGGVDVEGNPFGTDLHDTFDDPLNSMDDSFNNVDDTFSGIDDSFNSIDDSFSDMDDSFSSFDDPFDDQF
jgi:hypothetical protein